MLGLIFFSSSNFVSALQWRPCVAFCVCVFVLVFCDCPERLYLAILRLADINGCISFTLDCLTLYTHVLILEDWSRFLRCARLCVAAGTVHPRLLLFAHCAQHHTRIQVPRFYRSTFAHGTTLRSRERRSTVILSLTTYRRSRLSRPPNSYPSPYLSGVT